MTLEELKKAVNEFFSDKSRSASLTLEGLEEVRDDIDMNIDALREDANNEGNDE